MDANSSGVLVDVVIIVLALLFAINGYRQGFIISALTFLGFFGGALIGVQLSPHAADYYEDPMTRVVIALVIVFGLALIGQLAATAVGARLRRRLRRDGTKRIDELGGPIVSVLAVLLVAWMAAAPMASSGTSSVAAAVRNSTIVRAIDENLPEPVRGLYDALQESVNTSDFPDVFAGLDPTNAPPVEPPDAELAASPVVQDAQDSVLKVLGSAPSCDRRIEGSSFVYAPERLITNAHVVAGTDSVEVETAQGRLTAHVVVFDDERDLAVLYVPGLAAEPLPVTDERADAGTDTIVLGFPQGGPYTATPSRVREGRLVRGPNIYGDSEVTRDVYSLRARVISGNSGGPLLTTDGDVTGVIFAAAVDDPETGYALTMEETRPVMDAGLAATATVDTKGCT